MKKVSGIKLRCDKAWANLIKKEGKCKRCGVIRGRLEAAHIFSRRYLSLRYDYKNGVVLCSACHRWVHNNPMEFSKWVDEKYPDRYEYLLDRKHVGSKLRYEDYENILQSLLESRKSF